MRAGGYLYGERGVFGSVTACQMNFKTGVRKGHGRILEEKLVGINWCDHVTRRSLEKAQHPTLANFVLKVGKKAGSKMFVAMVCTILLGVHLAEFMVYLLGVQYTPWGVEIHHLAGSMVLVTTVGTILLGVRCTPWGL